MVKTRHKGEVDNLVEEEGVVLGKRRTRSAPVLPDQINVSIDNKVTKISTSDVYVFILQN